MRAAVAGDRVATASLMAELLPRIRNLVRFLVRGDSESDDINQEALVVVLRGLSSFRNEGPFKKWLDRTIVRATFAELRRRRADRRLFAIAEELPVVADERVAQAEEYVLRRWAVRVLDELPDEQRHAVVLHHLVEMTVPEIADELSLPQETVRSRLRLARARLRARGVDVADGASDETADGPAKGQA